MTSRCDFLKMFSAGATLTAAGLLVPELLKPERRIWAVGADLRHATLSDELRAAYGDSIGVVAPSISINVNGHQVAVDFVEFHHPRRPRAYYANPIAKEDRAEIRSALYESGWDVAFA